MTQPRPVSERGCSRAVGVTGYTSRRGKRPTSALLALLWLGLAGCTPDAGARARIIVTSDLDLPSQLDRVDVIVTGAALPAPRRARVELSPPRGGPLPQALELRSAGAFLGPYTVRVVGMVGEEVVVEQSREITLLRGQTIGVVIDLPAACIGVVCDVREVCVSGLCASPPAPERDAGTSFVGPLDAGHDASFDGGLDAGFDAGLDGGFDAGLDGGFDAGLDAGFDAGLDAGQPDADVCRATTETCNGVDDDCDSNIDEAAGCPCRRRQRAGHAYLFCEDRRSWSDARTECQRLGYDLAVIDDSAENAWVWARASARGHARFWIGLTDRASEMTWVWIDGRAVWTTGTALGYTNWEVGEPDDGMRVQDCAVMRRSMGGRWADRDCTNPTRSICETR